MKKIMLYDKEEILHKVKYSNQSTSIQFLLFTLFAIIFDRLNNIDYLSIVAFLFMFIFVVPSFLKLVFNLYRRLFQRIYITNERIIIVNGYFLKWFKFYYLKDVHSVLYKARKFDQLKSSASVKVIFKNKKHFMFRNVTFGVHIAKLVSVILNKEQQEN